MPRQTKTQKRYAFIHQKVLDGTRALLSDPRYDWKRESEEIYEAAEDIESAKLGYAEGRTEEDEVKKSYRAWVELHLKVA